MSRNHFVMETKGYCLFCLRLSTEVQVGHDEEGGIKSNISSLQRVCHYLRLDRRKIFNDIISVSPASSPVLVKSELKGVLCPECSKLTETISEITSEMEVLQMKLDSTLLKMNEKIKDAEKDTKLKEEFKFEMLNNPQTVLHFGIVGQLRKETLDKSSALIGQAQPQVILSRFWFSKPVTSQSQPPMKANVRQEPEQEPELSQSFPVISSVQGNYNGNPTAPPPPPVIPSLPYKCHSCPKSYRTHTQRRDHEKTKHQGIKFHCGFCPRTFTFRSSMHTHRRHFHKTGKKPFRSFRMEVDQADPVEDPITQVDPCDILPGIIGRSISTPAYPLHIGNIERIEVNDEREAISGFLPEDEPMMPSNDPDSGGGPTSGIKIDKCE